MPLKLFQFSLLLGLGFPEEPPLDFYADFRGKPVDKKSLRYTGPQADQCIKAEAEGLHITLPGDQVELSTPVGLVTSFRIKGDFEITLGYDILRADRPKLGYGVGVELYLAIDTPAEDALGLYRFNRTLEGDVYQCSHMKYTPERKRDNRVLARKKTAAKSGQLRVQRVGTLATFFTAEGESSDFQRLQQVEVGVEDVKGVYLRAFPGKSHQIVDIRFKDFRIRSPEAATKPPVALPPPGTAPAPEPAVAGGKTLWILGGLLAAGLILGGFWVWWRRPSSNAAEQEDDEFPPVAPRRRLKGSRE